MTTLSKPLRNQLERAVKQARVAAEQGAQQALEALAVHNHEPWGSMDAEQRQLRRRLRAHGRQLGDQRDPQSGRQRLERLSEEVAYEFWHRMLFARFLAENELLIETRYNVPITFAECEELAREQGEDPWDFAAGLAQAMLPQIFRDDSPAFELSLPPEHQLRLVRLLEELPAESFHASDALGWVYQFWQTARKDEINATGNKIGARELPVVTQLFTEPYMVSFLLDNALGAWWAAQRLSADDLRNADTEQELRDKAAIPGVPLEYLRFVRTEDGAWTPAAGAFERWPDQLAELKVLDPCCGSGHFLVAVFLMLVPMRMQLDGLNAREAADAVLRENLHGLELDQRCVELAAFALALTAWKYPNSGGYRVLPGLNVACTGLSISVKKEDWLELAGDNTNLRLALGELYKQFLDAPALGSLINPETSLGKGSLFELKWEEAGPLLTKALAKQKDEEKAEMGVVAEGLSNAATILQNKFHWVITNVPYLGAGRQSKVLRQYAEKHYPDGKADLANVFLERCLEFLEPNERGLTQVVMPENWLFLYTYTKQRTKLLNSARWNFLVNLGGGAEAFECGPGNAVNICLIALKSTEAAERPAPDWVFRGVDLTKYSNPRKKAAGLISEDVASVLQKDQLENPDARVHLGDKVSLSLLSNSANSFLGLGTGDFSKFGRNFWEFPSSLPEGWERIQCAPEQQGHYGGNSYLVAWDSEERRVRGMDPFHRKKIHNQDQSGQQAWDKNGIAVALSGNLKVTIYSGSLFDKSLAALIPLDATCSASVFSFCSSDEFLAAVRKIDKKIIVANGTLIKVPFDLEYWTKIAVQKYPNGLPEPYSDDPTQWLFHGHPCGSVVWDEEKKWTRGSPSRCDVSVLQVAVARLLGYQWPAELSSTMELADEQREWVDRCKELLPFADEDGIVCLPPGRGESAAADRLRELLKAAYGDTWSASTERELLAASSGHGKAPSSLDQWLREQFFEQHCKLFQARPFIWHIWDGRKDGFHALVNYHKLSGPNGQGRRTLEALTYSYLGEWIDRQRSDQQNDVEGSDARLAAALMLQGELKKILEGEPPYDLFIRWKPLHEQPLGWNPDINDGVRLNIRPFVLAQDLGRKGAGILRSIVDKTWTNAKKIGVKDRGKEVDFMRPRDQFPWFWSCDPEKLSEHLIDFGAPLPDAVPAGKKFDGLRWNNLHYSRAAREAARVAHNQKD
ncbi:MULTISPECIES: Eco57I restriction-modification methylase domain-containing protein [unclassified Wenzhouxiangella]|uniref:Eco57I restriction-modification methylase domain-containing protein n=1 Tax=unclassified Wenzhouxiangella TaxID=2613841 RepID=UPI000E3253C8|nr:MULTISPECIES: DNA methyltransferase [unclassified Wenzhouxiangella]RFF27206.1 SAM-dependent DNA methyltransferase [Wenzhouxiangella sp. 15181]RFP69107.1 SAM-dependent DNA methyltransferase [Wenzhouxiangella sp. 15190]